MRSISLPFLRFVASWFALASAFAVLTTATFAAPVNFDLPAQPAAASLVAFARHAKVEVLFSSADLKNVRTNAVHGLHEPEQALALLLRGTGYSFARNSTGKFVILRESKRSAGVIQGTAIGIATNRPVAGAIIRLIDSNQTTRTRDDGTFVLREVRPGLHAVVIQAEGHIPLRVTDLLVPGDRPVDLGAVRLTAATDSAQQLTEMVVEAEALQVSSAAGLFTLREMIVTPSRYGLEEERGTVAATLTEADLLALPQLGDDLYRAISHLPGLAADDLTARFWIRGAPHEQLLARLDGVDLIEPFHLKDTDGSLSILDLQTIRRLDLHTGGFGAEYGDRSAGVLTMETDSHVRARPRTTLGLSLTGAHAANRGQAANGRSRWLVSARSGYPDIALKNVDDAGKSEIRPRYHDVMGKWELNLTPDHTLSFHALHAGDRMFFRDSDGPVLTSRYESDYSWARWRGPMGPLIGEAVVSWTQMNWKRDGAGPFAPSLLTDLHENRELRSVGLRQDWTASLSERALLRGGFEYKRGEADYDFNSARDWFVFRNGAFQIERRSTRADLSVSGYQAGAYFATRIRPVTSFIVEPSVRYDHNDYAHDSDVSPRLNLAWNRSRTTWRAAWGIYTQAEGLHRLAVQDGDTTFRRAERAEHRIVSVEHQLRAGVNLRLEAYERRVRHPRPRWENIVDTGGALPELNSDRVRLDPARQRARGIELIAEQRRSQTFTWSASYAFARTEETLRSGLTLPRARDQRHTVYADVSYAPNPRWQFSVAAQYHTGWPTTELSYFPARLASGGSVALNRFGPFYALRLPAYHRIDVRAQRRFELRQGTLRVFVDVFNLLNRHNTINYAYDVRFAATDSVEVTRRRGESLFPRLPSAGLTWDF
jgi:hypothetical protein